MSQASSEFLHAELILPLIFNTHVLLLNNGDFGFKEPTVSTFEKVVNLLPVKTTYS